MSKQITGAPAFVIRLMGGVLIGISTWVVLMIPVSFVFGAGGLLTDEGTFGALILFFGMFALFPSLLIFGRLMGFK